MICCQRTNDATVLAGDETVLRLYWEIFTSVQDIGSVADQVYAMVTTWRREQTASSYYGSRVSLVHAAAESSESVALCVLPILHRFCTNMTGLKDNDGRLPIHCASRGSVVSSGVVKRLASLTPSTLKMADCRNNDTPIHLLAERIHTVADGPALLESLLQYEDAREALVLQDDSLRTPLQRAMQLSKCTFQTVKMLADASPASIRLAQRQFPETVFQQACIAEWENPSEADEAARYPLHMEPSAASISHPPNGYPLHFSARLRSLETLQLIYELCPQSVSATNTNSYKGTPLHEAAMSGDVCKVKYLYELFPDAIKLRSTDHGSLPLHSAVFHSCRKSTPFDSRAKADEAVVSFLFSVYPEAAAVAGWSGRYALHGAARYDSFELLQRIYHAHPAAVKHYKEYSPRPWIGLPLHLAAESGDMGKLQFLYSIYPEAISLEIPEINCMLPFHSALYSLPSSHEDSARKRKTFLLVYELHPSAATARVIGADDKMISSLQILLHCFLNRRHQGIDYEFDFLLWKIRFVLKLCPTDIFQRWVRDDRDYLWEPQRSIRNRRDIYSFCVNEVSSLHPLIPRLMLQANRDHDPAALRSMNYRDRRGAVYLLFSRNLNGDHYYPKSGGGDRDRLLPLWRLVSKLRVHGNKDLMRKVVMML